MDPEPSRSTDVDADRRLVVLIPVYNDWDAVQLLIDRLDAELSATNRTVRVLIVDDGSTMPGPSRMGSGVSAISAVEVLVLRRNLGHQRAIAIGLAYVYDRMRAAAVLIMDGDGEDAPQDVPRLIARLDATGHQKIIFAERRRRSEGVVFSVFYSLYRGAHRLLTGIPVRVGNFSAIPAGHVERLVVDSELWIHYAAAVLKARLPRDTIPTVRGHRLGGQSSMNFVSLVGHGLSALSVHAETIGVRLLVVALTVAVLVGALLCGVVAVRLFTSLAIPGWATAAVGLLIVILSQVVAFAVLFVFLVLHARSQPLFIPIRDYSHFVSSVRRVAGSEEIPHHGGSPAATMPR